MRSDVAVGRTTHWTNIKCAARPRIRVQEANMQEEIEVLQLVATSLESLEGFSTCFQHAGWDPMFRGIIAYSCSQ